MTVTELLDRILAAYPGATPEAMATFKPVFYTRFRAREGDALQAAFDEVLATFKPKYGQPFPIPADFEAHLPSFRLTLLKGGKDAPLAIQGHGEKTRRILAEWRLAQGHRGANGNTEVLRALEFIAEPLAALNAWTDDAAPLRLTSKQLKVAQQRAISQERRRKYGPPPRTNEQWWEQIQEVAAGWNIPAAYEEWGHGEQAVAAE